jgi:hypothetical protein
MNTLPRPWLVLVLLTFGLAGCSSVATPQLIASAPLSESPSNAGPSDGKSMPRAYYAYVEIEVSDVESAAEQIREITWEYNGSITDSIGWESEGCCHRQVSIIIPTSNFHAILRALPRIGIFLREEADRPPDERFNLDYRGSQSTLVVHLVSRAANCAPREERIAEVFARLAAMWVEIQKSILQTGLAIFVCVVALVPVALMLIGLTTCLRWLSRR